MKGNEIVSYDGVHCANCAAPMQGEFCHECGQSIHTVLKPVHHMFEDTLETFLHVDGRVLHTLPPLLTKPGFLTLEYFAGRRQRYVPPFRLMFVLCLLAFFLTHIAIDALSDHGGSGKPAHIEAEFDNLQTPAQVNKVLDQKLEDLRKARQQTASVPGVDVALLTAEADLREQAATRIAKLQAEHSENGGAAASASVPAPATATSAPASAASASAAEAASALSARKEERRKNKDEVKQWLTGHDHVHVSWLPGFMNAKLDHSLGNLRENMRGLNSHDLDVRDQAIERIKAGIFGALPQTMFILMPVFALLLKLLYLFKRRLYMEHLIVALHSHAFLFALLLLGALLALLKAWIAPHAAWLGQGLGWLETALSIWAPVYLLLMQKRIYRQGWPMTIVKYLVIGWCYLWLLGFFVMGALALGLAH